VPLLLKGLVVVYWKLVNQSDGEWHFSSPQAHGLEEGEMEQGGRLI